MDRAGRFEKDFGGMLDKLDRPPIGANWNKGGPGSPMPSENAGALVGGITGAGAGTNIGSRLWRALAGDTTNSEKSAELTGNQEEIDVNNNGITTWPLWTKA